MSHQSKTIETIRRLLRLGESSNEHEAQSALSKAAALARKHSIDLGSVKAEEARARVIEREFESRDIYGVVEQSAIQLCMALFSVRCITYSKSEFRFIGLEHNIEAALFARDFVLEQCARDLKAFKRQRYQGTRRRTSKGAALQYCMGWTFAVERNYKRQLEAIAPTSELESQKSALILRDQQQEVAAYMGEHYDKIPSEKPPRYKEDTSAFFDGMVDGQNVSLRSPLEGGQSYHLLGGTAA